MMKVTADKKACAGHAQCYALAPKVYELDEDGYCISDHHEVPTDEQANARDGALSCPEMAITVED